jgi:uncharacterized membrane protein YidH (DUF202 family)
MISPFVVWILAAIALVCFGLALIAFRRALESKDNEDGLLLSGEVGFLVLFIKASVSGWQHSGTGRILIAIGIIAAAGAVLVYALYR